MPLVSPKPQLFHGLAAFPITPSNDAGQVDTDALARLLARLVAADMPAIGLLGSTGTYAYLTRSERRRAILAATACIGGRAKLIVGVGALRTDDAQDLARDAEAAGADGLLLAPMSYTPLSDEEVFRHFEAVAASTGLPICIYNNPTTTHFSFGTQLLARLAAVPRLVAVKHPAPPPAEAPAQVEALRRALPAEFALGYSVDWHAARAILAGGAAWYSVIAGFLPHQALTLMRAAQAGDVAAVLRIDEALAPLWDLFRQHGSLRVAYAAANLSRLSDAQPPRPILPLAGPVRAQLARVLHDLAA